MKIVRLFKLVSLLGIMFALQGCPITHNTFMPYIFQAQILSNQDTLEVRFPAHDGKYHVDTIFPSNYLVCISWEEERNSTGNATLSKLQVRKFTNHAESIVIEERGVFIDDVYYNFSDIYRDPADSIHVIDSEWGNPQTIIRHVKDAPCSLEYVIEQLSKDYPNLIHRISDTERHDFNNPALYESVNWIPRIYLPK